MISLQQQRLVWRSSFFLLFILAPPLDLFRLDLTLGHFILLGQNWTLGLESLVTGEVSPLHAAINLIGRAFIPLAIVIGGGIGVAWKYGRLYCGWLCPHFSVVEMINGLMRRASGKPTLWEAKPLPVKLPNGKKIQPQRRYWLLVVIAIIGFALLWGLTLLTYLLPPTEIYYNLWHGQLTRNQTIFLSVSTTIFALEFLLARHLFCRFGCAVGLFKSLAWMGNHQAMVVDFDRQRAHLCADCQNACDNACPMRLKPRSIKRKKFTCTQCAQCISACAQVQINHPQGSLLTWTQDEKALNTSGYDSKPGKYYPAHLMLTEPWKNK